MIDLTEWKTFTLSILVLVGTFYLIQQGILPAENWWQGAGVAAGAYTVRTAVAKLSNGGTKNATK